VKQFWDDVTIETAADGFAVLLDGKPLRLPDGGLRCIPGEALARAVAAEWQLAAGRPARALRVRTARNAHSADAGQRREAGRMPRPLHVNTYAARR
jgi:hypothetical protein